MSAIAYAAPTHSVTPTPSYNGTPLSTTAATQARIGQRIQAVPPHVQPPASLTSGIPNPDTVQRQKEGYVKNLDDQLKGGASALDQQVQAQRDEVRAQAEREKQAFNMRVDQQVRMQQMQVEHVYAQQVKELKKHAMRQRALLEQQALQLSFEYQDKRHEEEHMQKQYALHTEQRSLQERINGSDAATHGVLQPLGSTTVVHAPQPASYAGYAGTTTTIHSAPNSYVPALQGLASHTPPVAVPQGVASMGGHSTSAVSFSAMSRPVGSTYPTYAA